MKSPWRQYMAANRYIRGHTSTTLTRPPKQGMTCHVRLRYSCGIRRRQRDLCAMRHSPVRPMRNRTDEPCRACRIGREIVCCRYLYHLLSITSVGWGPITACPTIGASDQLQDTNLSGILSAFPRTGPSSVNRLIMQDNTKPPDAR